MKCRAAFLAFFLSLSLSIDCKVSKPPLEIAFARDLYHFNGKYLSTIVGTYQTANYTAAEAFCRSNGFELFTLLSSANYFAFILEVVTSLNPYMIPATWVNGRQQSSGSWFAFNPNATKVLREMAPKGVKNGHNCLKFVVDSLVTQTEKCDLQMPFVCERYGKLLANETVIVSRSNVSDIQHPFGDILSRTLASQKTSSVDPSSGSSVNVPSASGSETTKSAGVTTKSNSTEVMTTIKTTTKVASVSSSKVNSDSSKATTVQSKPSTTKESSSATKITTVQTKPATTATVRPTTIAATTTDMFKGISAAVEAMGKPIATPAININNDLVNLINNNLYRVTTTAVEATKSSTVNSTSTTARLNTTTVKSSSVTSLPTSTKSISASSTTSKPLTTTTLPKSSSTTIVTQTSTLKPTTISTGKPSINSTTSTVKSTVQSTTLSTKPSSTTVKLLTTQQQTTTKLSSTSTINPKSN